MPPGTPAHFVPFPSGISRGCCCLSGRRSLPPINSRCCETGTCADLPCRRSPSPLTHGPPLHLAPCQCASGIQNFANKSRRLGSTTHCCMLSGAQRHIAQCNEDAMHTSCQQGHRVEWHSRCCSDFVNLIQMDRHAACSVQLLVAFAALKVFACMVAGKGRHCCFHRMDADGLAIPMQWHHTQLSRTSTMESASRAVLTLLVGDQRRLVSEYAVTVEAEDHLPSAKPRLAGRASIC